MKMSSICKCSVHPHNKWRADVVVVVVSYVMKSSERTTQVKALQLLKLLHHAIMIALIIVCVHAGLSTQRCTETYSKATGAYVVHHSPRYVQYRTSYPTSLHVMSDDVMCVCDQIGALIIECCNLTAEPTNYCTLILIYYYYHYYDFFSFQILGRDGGSSISPYDGQHLRSWSQLENSVLCIRI